MPQWHQQEADRCELFCRMALCRLLWSLALRAGIPWLFPSCNTVQIMPCLTWDIFKGIRISLLVYTWYCIVGFFYFCSGNLSCKQDCELELQECSSWTGFALQLPQAAWKDKAKPVDTVVTGGQIIIYCQQLCVSVTDPEPFVLRALQTCISSALRRFVAREPDPHLWEL